MLYQLSYIPTQTLTFRVVLKDGFSCTVKTKTLTGTQTCIHHQTLAAMQTHAGMHTCSDAHILRQERWMDRLIDKNTETDVWTASQPDRQIIKLYG